VLAAVEMMIGDDLFAAVADAFAESGSVGRVEHDANKMRTELSDVAQRFFTG
jgi:hypothetical protein